MKNLVLGAAAAAALLAPGIASADTTNAVVGIDYNHLDLDSFGDGNQYGINGAVNHDFAGAGEIQVDGAVERSDGGFCCFSQSFAAVHYGTRTDQYSFAGFVGTQSLGIFSGVDVGLEGQWHFSQASIGGSVSYVDFGDFDANAWNANVDGMYFFTPNFSVNAGVGYSNFDEGGSTDYWTWNLGGEYRFDNSPFSVSLGYRQGDLDGGDISAWMVGINLDLSTGSLQERRTHGPSWGGARSLYDDVGQLSPFFIL